MKEGQNLWVRREKGGKPPSEKNKLSKRDDGPFRIMKMRDKTAIIDRNTVFDEIHLSRLERVPKPKSVAYYTPTQNGQGEREGEEGYVIDRITDHSVYDKGNIEFKVKWEFHKDLTWKPETKIGEASEESQAKFWHGFAPPASYGTPNPETVRPSSLRQRGITTAKGMRQPKW